AIDTMYGGGVRRARAICTFRVLGFSRVSILVSFVVESLLLSLLGGLFGVLLVMPLNGLKSGIGNFGTTFSEIGFDFRITPFIVLVGIAFATIMGIFGGLLSARAAAKQDILN